MSKSYHQQFQDERRNTHRQVSTSNQKATAGHQLPPVRPTAVVKQATAARSNTFTLTKNSNVKVPQIDQKTDVSSKAPRKPSPALVPPKKLKPVPRQDFIPRSILNTSTKKTSVEQRKPVRFASNSSFAFNPSDTMHRLTHDDYRKYPSAYPSNTVSELPPVRSASRRKAPPTVIIRSKEVLPPEPPTVFPTLPPMTSYPSAPWMMFPSSSSYLSSTTVPNQAFFYPTNSPPQAYYYPFSCSLPPQPAQAQPTIVNQSSSASSSAVTVPAPIHHEERRPMIVLSAPARTEEKHVTIRIETPARNRHVRVVRDAPYEDEEVYYVDDAPRRTIIRRPPREVVYVDDIPRRTMGYRENHSDIVYVDDSHDEEVIYVDEDGNEIESIYDEPIQYRRRRRSYPRVRHSTRLTNVVYQ